MQLQIEREMLSSMMNAGDEFFELARTKIRPEYFSIEHHGLIFEALIAAYDATGGKDRSSTVIMSQAGKIQRAPGVAMLDEFDDLDIDIDYLDGIRKMMVSAEAGKEHVSYIHEQADRKRLKDAATEIYSVADGNDPDYREKSEKLFGEAVMGDSDESVYSGTQLAAMVWNGLTGAQPIKSSNSLTGIFEVDDYFLGFTAGAYYLIAAPTHNGKTIVGKNLIVQAAYNSDIVFVYFPFEENELLAEISFWSLMTGPDIKWIIEKEEPKNRIPMHKKRISEIIAYRYDPESVLRRYASKKAAGKEDSTFREPSPMEMLEYENAYATMSKVTRYVEPNPSSVGRMRSTVRKAVRENKGKHIVAVLDYIQIAANGEDDYKSIGLISRGVARSVAEDGPAVTWLVMSQFNRGQGTNSLKTDVNYQTKPREKLPLTALKDCPSLENDPHVILHMMQNSLYMSPTELALGRIKELETDSHKLSVSIMKNRITNELEDFELFLWKRNGFLLNRKI